MDWARAKDIAATLQSFTTILAFIIGGWWTYRKFIVQRLDEPATDLEIDVRFVGTQDDQWIVEITTTLDNKSLVRLKYEQFQLTARYLLAGDKVEDGGAKINYQLLSHRTIDERINNQKRFYANSDYINPKQEFRHRYISYIPIDATFLWIQCKFSFAHGQKVNAQRIFRVPDSALKLSCQPADNVGKN